MISIAIKNLTFKDGVCFAPCKYGNNVASIEWENLDNPHPTDEEMQTEMDRLQAEYDAQEYARNRQAEYPTIQELVVALYDTDDKTVIETKRAEVKAKYPKPE
jgi:hypothetical protein